MIYYQPNAFSNSYNFASVTEAEESRRKMRDKIFAVTNHHKPSETFHNSLTRKSPKNAGSAESHPCYFNVGTIVFHIFIYTGVTVTFPLVVPYFLIGALPVNTPVIYATFDDNSGIILARADGEWNHATMIY